MSAATSYCYTVSQAGVSLLASPVTFTTGLASSSSADFSFAVIGDWGAGTTDEAAADGAGGENDNVHADVESARGGSKADSLVGGPGPNRLFGLGGPDSLDGRLGPDVLADGFDPEAVVAAMRADPTRGLGDALHPGSSVAPLGVVARREHDRDGGRRRGQDLPGHSAHRHPAGGALLPARRHPAVCDPPAAEEVGLAGAIEAAERKTARTSVRAVCLPKSH